MKRDVDKLFDDLAAKNKTELNNAKITPIHPKFQFAENGIWVMIGTMGSGKTYNYLKLAARQEDLYKEPFFELVTVCSTSGEFDKTVKTFKSAIEKSHLEFVDDNDLLDYLMKHMAKTMLYNVLMNFLRRDMKKPCDKMLELIKTHGLNNRLKLTNFVSKQIKSIGWNTFPCRMLLILDDFASHPLFKSKSTPLSALLKKLRHFNITVLICVQTVLSIPPDIKRIMSDCILWKGISKKSYKYLLDDSSLNFIDGEKFWKYYSKIKDPHIMIGIHEKAHKIIKYSPKNTQDAHDRALAR